MFLNSKNESFLELNQSNKQKKYFLSFFLLLLCVLYVYTYLYSCVYVFDIIFEWGMIIESIILIELTNFLILYVVLPVGLCLPPCIYCLSSREHIDRDMHIWGPHLYVQELQR